MNEDYDLTAKSLFESLLGKSFEVEAQEELPQAYYEPPTVDLGELPIFEEEDRDILMHRDTHFGGNFPMMLEHYEDEGMAAVLDVENSRIAFLMDLEKKLNCNLAPFLLQGPDAEKVAQSKKLYTALQAQSSNHKMPLIQAIANLILDEELPEKKAKNASKVGAKLVPYLIQLIQTPLFFEPLAPGYGLAPIAAILTLGHLHAKEAIKPLFELIGDEQFEIESAALQALSLIGKEAHNFCISQLKERPITKNNERAAILASSLGSDPELAVTLLEQLEDPQIQKNERLATYLVLACSDLPKSLYSRFSEIGKKMPDAVREEMDQIINSH